MEDLRAVVQRVAELPLADLEAEQLQAVALDLHTAIGRLHGKLDEVLGQLDLANEGTVPEGEQERPVHAWWRDSTRRTGQQAAADLRRAQVLRELPLIGRAVTDGVLSQEQAAVLGRLHGRLETHTLQESQARLIEAARPQPTDALGRWVANLIAAYSERALEADEERARERRFFQTRTQADGSVRGSFLIPREDAEALHAVLEPLARRQNLTDTRSVGQRRADALIDVFHAAGKWMDLPVAGGQRAHVGYVVTAQWCAGEPPPPLSEHLAVSSHPLTVVKHSANGAWTGPQTRGRMEAVLCDARVSRLLQSPDSTVLSLESVSDEITPAQRKAVSLRDRSCVAKGCTRAPAFCDVHHLQHREHGGPTEVDNLALLCRRHHVQWHNGHLDWRDLHVPWLDPGGTTPAEDPDTWDPPLTA